MGGFELSRIRLAYLVHLYINTQYEVSIFEVHCQRCKILTSDIYCVTFRVAREPLDPKEMTEMPEIQALM